VTTAPPPNTITTNWVNIVGDTGFCGSPVMAQLSRLVNDLGGDLLLAGDIAYPSGTMEQYMRCFDPELGRFKSRSWAAPGNHEYETAGAAGYFNYFGERAGPERRGYYAIREATWQVLMLNSNLPMTRNSPQYEFARLQLQTNPARCAMAIMHHPFDTSGPNGPNANQRDLWEMMYGLGVDVVVSGHDHIYERHAPQDASQQSDPVRGIRLFIAGTGGATPYHRARSAQRSEMFLSVQGLLRLKLEPALYEWEFIDVNGSVRDRGLNICH
jgi:3',5'-cyclic AMP phosphodiesterase CpdA